MFLEALQENINQNELNEKKVTISKFLKEIDAFDSLDDFLSNQPDNYLQFYLDNAKTLDKTLSKMNIKEATTLGMSTGDSEEVTYKSIKYKGNFITLEYSPELGSWLPTVRFRSVVQALRYAKGVADSI